MRPEEFDNRLQQKLDELNPVFNERDWIRLSKKMNASKTPVLFSKRISMILLLLFLALFGTWISFQWAELIPGSEINNGILKEELPAPIIVEGSDLKIYDNSDKPSIATQPVEKSNQLEAVHSTASSHTAINPRSNVRTNLANATSIKRNKAESNSTDKHIASNELVQNESKIATSINNKKDDNHSTIKSVTEEESVIAETKVQDQRLINQIPENEIAENVNTKVDDQSLVNKNAENGNAGLSGVNPIHSLAMQGLFINDKAQLRSQMKPVSGLKPYKWVIGATGLVAASHFNSGVTFEIKTKKSISFGSGLVIQKYLEQDYLDQNEFTATNEADFTDLIRPRYSKSDSFSNIKIKSMDVLLPLSLKYYFPLNTRFALFANASMQLTLYSKTTLDFKSVTQENQILNVSDFDQASNSATLINHFTIGAGLQREFKNFVIQTGFLIQKNNSNQPQITKQEMAGQISILYKL